MIILCLDRGNPLAFPPAMDAILSIGLIPYGQKTLIPAATLNLVGQAARDVIDRWVASGRAEIAVPDQTEDVENAIAAGTLATSMPFVDDSQERVAAVVGTAQDAPSQNPNWPASSMPASISEPPYDPQTQTMIEETSLVADTPAANANLIERTGQPNNATTAVRPGDSQNP